MFHLRPVELIAPTRTTDRVCAEVVVADPPSIGSVTPDIIEAASDRRKTIGAANAACSGNNENFCKEFPIAQGLEWGLGLGIYGAFKAGKLPFGMQEYMDGYFGKGATLGVAASRKKAAEAKQGRK